jgi:hypothetical protein
MSATQPDAGKDQEPGAGVAARSGTDTWSTAGWKSVLILALAALGFLVIPDRLVTYLALHTAPRTRDLLVLLWVVVFFVFLTWLFIRLQPRGGR